MSALLYRVQSPIAVVGSAPAIFLLHGIGSHEHDLMSLASYFDPQCYVFSLRAPLPYGNGGYSWFDLSISASGLKVDAIGAAQSRQQITSLLADLCRDYALDQTQLFLVGFSQGAMLGLSQFLHEPTRWAGIAALSGCLLPDLCPASPEGSALRDKPVLISHGIEDEVVPLLYAEYTRDHLADLPVKLTYRTYPMGHQVSADSLQDLVLWLRAQLSLS